MGPDAVGGRGRVTSPFGLEDLIGSAYEWVTLGVVDGEVGARGGAFFSDTTSAVVYNKSVVSSEFRDWQTGARICAQAPD